MTDPISVVAVIVGVIVIPYLVIKVLYQVVRLVFVLLGRVADLVGGVVMDAVHLVGHLVSGALHIPLVVISLLFWRWDRAGSNAASVGSELAGSVRSFFSALIYRPLRFLGLMAKRQKPALAGVPAEDPSAMEFDDFGAAPKATRANDEFDGYKVVGTLPRGGSGARLFIAEPEGDKASHLARQAGAPVDRVVIKAFSLDDGSTMPQIVRESRALEAARDLGLVFEHSLDGSRFHYVMPYVPGDDLATVTRDLHHDSGTDGLNAGAMRAALNYFSELLVTIERFHHKGLWHKDIKPSNVIVSKGRVHLVDLGLVTPLRSAMTLTTHGTEYFRDPEMVRLAMQGVKVHEVDGVKFDLYSAGALLYSMLENSFPAHGSLSRFSLRVPQALQWIVRRSMADMDKRYESAGEMLADLETVLASNNPFGLKPGELPSTQGRKLHFKSWQAGSVGSSFRNHGFDEEPRFSRRQGNFEERFTELGDRLTGAGERVRERVGRMTKNVSSGMERRTARFEARAHSRAANQNKRRKGTPTIGIVAILLLLPVVVAGVALVGVSPHEAPMFVDAQGGTFTTTVSSPSPSHGISYGVSSSGSPVIVRMETERSLGDRFTYLEDSLEREIDELQEILEFGELREVMVRSDFEELSSIQQGARVLFLTDLSRNDSLAYENALRELPIELVGTGSSPAEIEALALARNSVAFAQIDDERSVDLLREFLVDSPDLQAIYWIGHVDNGEILAHIIQRP